MAANLPREIVVAGAVRTPVGSFGGALRPLSAVDLGVAVATASMSRAGISPEVVEEVVFGLGRPAGTGPNPARQVSVRAGVPDAVPAYTVNKACASSLLSIVQAARVIALGESDVVLAGGMESMSNTPYLIEGARWGLRLGHQPLLDAMYRDGFVCPLADKVMGETAETLARKYGISREEQDAYAASSQNRCQAAAEAGRFADEILPLTVPGRKGDLVVEHDEHPRRDVTVESLARLRPVFAADGSVHAGNSSGITDGAAAVVVLSADAAERLQVDPLARITAWSRVGVDPSIMGIGPVPALRKLEEESGVSHRDVDLVELNEAFAAQVLACDRELELDRERLNVNGGAIAIGHPIGATGARISVTLLHEMARRDARRGIATLCVSGGLGMAVLFETVSRASRGGGS
jgi:acetyl-CoA C-acetyltransferase